MKDVCIAIAKQSLVVHSIGIWSDNKQAYYNHEAKGYIDTSRTDNFEFYFLTYRELKNYINIGIGGERLFVKHDKPKKNKNNYLYLMIMVSVLIWYPIDPGIESVFAAIHLVLSGIAAALLMWNIHKSK